MCGIAGIVGRIGPENRAALRRMNDALAHRGPDGEGFWEGPPDANGFGPMLAHRRLSILDLSTAGSQPMIDRATGDVVVLNGEIYNYVALREDLIAAGQEFESSGDTMVMLRSLALNGCEAIARLRGMFAIGFWDSSARTLTLARDPLGIKPLYIARNPDPRGDWSLLFASEVRGILASNLLPKRELDAGAMASVVWNGFTVAPQTAVEGVESLYPGEYRVFDARGRETSAVRFWSLAGPSPVSSCDERVLDEALKECVRLHLASDVPLAVFLSGGVDSSAVANLANAVSDSPVHTFTLAFEERESNEAPFARKIAEAIGTQHQDVLLTERHFIEHLGAALDSLDQPTFDGLNSYFMSLAVREAGFKVALVGSGGDELFGGYSSFRDLPHLVEWSRRARAVPMPLRRAFANAVAALKRPRGASFPPQTRWAKLPEMVGRRDDLLGLYQLAYALFLPDFQQELLGRAAAGDGLPPVMRSLLEAEVRGKTPLAAIGVLEQRLFLAERLLRDTDAASMASSIEIRLPLVDSVLTEVVRGLDDQTRYEPRGRKALLRRLGLRSLDPGLFARPKSGFELPFNRWLRGALGREIGDTLRDPQAVRPTGLDPNAVGRLWSAFEAGSPGLYWTRIWALYAFVRWCHAHRVYAAAA